LLALVSASALLHSQQRKIGNDGAILADARDYHLARRLLAKPFAQSLGGGLSDSAVAFLVKLPADEEFTAKEVAKRMTVAKSSVSGWLVELHESGAVEITEQGRGRLPTKWKRTGKTPEPAANLLPTVESLFVRFAERVDAMPKC
jgi:hypothetical protein